MTIAYEPARGPGRGAQPGTQELARLVHLAYPQLIVNHGAYGIFNARRIAGSRSWSLHAEGRAIDIGIPLAQRGDQGDGWRCACALVASAAGSGVQRVIWDGHIWSIERRDGNWRALQSGDMHRDHIHVEQRWAWADGRRGVLFP